MITPTRHNWELFQQKCLPHEAEWLRSLTDSEALLLYQDLHKLARAQQDESPGWKRLEQQRWQEKVAIRRKLHEAFTRLDQRNGN